MCPQRGREHPSIGCAPPRPWASFRDAIDGALPRAEHTARDYDGPREWILDSMEHDEGMMSGCRWLIPRAVLDDAGGWDERLSLNNDFEFSIRLLDHAKGVHFAPEAILYYRQGVAGTLSKRFSRAAAESAWLTTRLGCERILGWNDSARSRGLCADRMQDWLFRLYPEHRDLASNAEREITRLGGSGRNLQGGTLFNHLSRYLSWKTLRIIQAAAHKSVWKPVLRWKARKQRKST